MEIWEEMNRKCGEVGKNTHNLIVLPGQGEITACFIFLGDDLMFVRVLDKLCWRCVKGLCL